MHILPRETDNCPAWISGRERMTRKYFMINLHERMLPTSAGLNPRSPGLQSDGASNWANETGSIRNWQLLFLYQLKGENDHRKYFMIKTMLRTWRRSNPQSPITSWTCIQLSHRGQLPFLSEQKGENDHRKYFRIHFHERMLPDPAGIEPVAFWSPVKCTSD